MASINEWNPEVRQKLIGASLDLSAMIDNYRIVWLLAVDNTGKAFSVSAERDDSGTLESIGLLKTMLAISEENMLSGYRNSDRPFADEGDDE